MGRVDGGHDHSPFPWDEWRNAHRLLAQAGWPSARLEALDELVATIRHDDAATVVIVQDAHGRTFVELSTLPVDAAQVTVGDAPALVPVIERRQRTLPHIVVVADRAGADIVAVHAGEPVETLVVEGDTEFIHRSHPGGWSQHRFQQRAENTWERNADDVVAAVQAIAQRTGPVLIAVAGEVRATSLIMKGLELVPLAGHPEVRLLAAGDPSGIADEVEQALADLHARLVLGVVQSIRSSPTAITRADDVMAALQDGRVGLLLVSERAVAGGADADRSGVRRPTTVDTAVMRALATSASVLVAPRTSELRDGLAATARW